jgi:acetyltransferase-like isoleucine patch superfamily enzyme
MVSDRLGLEPAVHPTAQVSECRLGRYTEVGARTRLSETVLDDYSYIVEDGQANYTRIGKFCSIASHVRINPGNHPMERASQSHFSYRPVPTGRGRRTSPPSSPGAGPCPSASATTSGSATAPSSCPAARWAPARWWARARS